MITTVTTTTTAVTTIAAAALALIAIVTMLAFLIYKEIVGGFSGPKAQRLNRALNIAIVPLLLAFLSIVIFKVADVLR